MIFNSQQVLRRLKHSPSKKFEGDDVRRVNPLSSKCPASAVDVWPGDYPGRLRVLIVPAAIVLVMVRSQQSRLVTGRTVRAAEPSRGVGDAFVAAALVVDGEDDGTEVDKVGKDPATL